MRMLSRIGVTSRLVAAAAVSFSLLTGVAMAENGYVDVRVRDDSAGCGPVVLKWPADQEEREYDPDPARNDPKLEMAETRPLPVIHHHPALNAGYLYLPPQDGVYRHYFPESEAPPRLRRWNRAEYEAYLREHNPSVEVPLADRPITVDKAAVPGTVIVPTGMVTPPVAFAGAPGAYVPITAPVADTDIGFGAIVEAKRPSVASQDDEDIGTADLATSLDGGLVVDVITPKPFVPLTLESAASSSVSVDAARIPAEVKAAPAIVPSIAKTVVDGEGTGSFITLSPVAEKVPFVNMPAPLTPSVSSAVSTISQTPALPDTPAEKFEAQESTYVTIPGATNLPKANCGTCQ